MLARNTTALCNLAALAAILLASTGCKATPVAERPRSAPIAVGTFNIRYANPRDGANAWQHRRDLVLDILREGDIWGLQEVLPQQLAEIGQALPEFDVLARSRDRAPNQGEACPLLFRTSRWSLDPGDHATFWLSTSPEQVASQSWDAALPRIVTYARLIEKQSGQAIYIYNAHFDHRGKQARLESARLLAQRIASRRHPDPVVVLGDFNTGPASAPIEALTNSPDGLLDAWRMKHQEAPERGTFSGWKQALGRTRIDHVLVHPQLEVETCWIDIRKPGGRWPSDHVPVRATLRLAIDTPTQPITHDAQ